MTQRTRGLARWLPLVVLLAGTMLVANADADEPPLVPYAVAVSEPVYDDLEALVARGIIRLPELYARPVLSYDVARALQHQVKQNPMLYADPTFKRAIDAFSTEVDILQHGRPAANHRAFVNIADQDNWLRIESQWRAHSEAFAERGFVFTDSTRCGLRFSWVVWPGFHLFEELYVASIDDGNIYGDPLKPGTDIVIFQDRVYGAIHSRYADIVLGRDRLAWGPGRTGSLLLSKTSRPFTQVRMSRTFFDGLFHAVIVNGVLNQNEERYVAFHRLDFRLHRNLRLGFAEGVRYDASGIEPLYLIGIVPYSIAERLLRRDNDARETDLKTRNNVMWSFDGTWQAHPRLRLYGEVLIDDIAVEANDHSTRLAFQFGTYGIGRLWNRELRLRGEWTRVWNHVYSTFYGIHFDHEGVPLGYPLGPDCRMLHTSADLIVDRTWAVHGVLERQDRGEGRLGAPWMPGDDNRPSSKYAGVVETQLHARAGFRYTPNATFEAQVALGPTWIENANHHLGETRRGLSGLVSLGYRY